MRTSELVWLISGLAKWTGSTTNGSSDIDEVSQTD